jgi:hypothetical protein
MPLGDNTNYQAYNISYSTIDIELDLHYFYVIYVFLLNLLDSSLELQCLIDLRIFLV